MYCFVPISSNLFLLLQRKETSSLPLLAALAAAGRSQPLFSVKVERGCLRLVQSSTREKRQARIMRWVERHWVTIHPVYIPTNTAALHEEIEHLPRHFFLICNVRACKHTTAPPACISVDASEATTIACVKIRWNLFYIWPRQVKSSQVSSVLPNSS